jgi:ferric-dicitrate binding protein FerR (iron transport regulator)
VSTHETRTSIDTRDGAVTVLGAQLPVEPTRIAAVAIAIVAVILGLWFGLRSRCRGDTAERQAERLGASLVDVEELAVSTSPVVWVSTMADLARVALTDGGIVLRHAHGDDREYAVTHDGTTYRFRAERAADHERHLEVLARPEGA